MNSSDVPAKFGYIWGNSASPSYIQDVPETYSGTPGSASLQYGWNSETFLDPSTGGTAPLGEYENGIWRQATANLRWIQAGGIFTFDAAFAAKIGGYPKGAILASATYSTFWKSIIENNTTNPDTGTLLMPATGWSVLQPGTYPWSQITGAPSFVLSTAFTGGNQSLAPNGFQKLPGGLILQWGSYTAPASDIAYTISLPTAFPNNHFASFASVRTSGTVAGSYSAYAVPASLSTVTLTGDVSSGSATNIPLSFWSIGN